MSLSDIESTDAVVSTGTTESTGAVVPVDAPESERATFISPRAIGLAWLVAMIGAMAINPATTEAVQPTLVLTILSNVAAFAWLGTIVVGGFKWSRTATLGFATGGLMLTGHLICGFAGHLPMTGAIWLTQLMLVAGATAISGLALATRR